MVSEEIKAVVVVCGRNPVDNRRSARWEPVVRCATTVDATPDIGSAAVDNRDVPWANPPDRPVVHMVVPNLCTGPVSGFTAPAGFVTTGLTPGATGS